MPPQQSASMRPNVETLSPTQNFKSFEILTVEDNEDHIFLLKSALAQSMPGLAPVVCTTGQEAIAYFEALEAGTSARYPRIILLDLYMPTREDGLGTLRSIKAFFTTHRITPIPIVMFSHSNDSEDISACYAGGANAYMLKHTDFDQWVGYFDKLRNFWFATVSLPTS